MTRKEQKKRKQEHIEFKSCIGEFTKRPERAENIRRIIAIQAKKLECNTFELKNLTKNSENKEVIRIIELLEERVESVNQLINGSLDFAINFSKKRKFIEREAKED